MSSTIINILLALFALISITVILIFTKIASLTKNVVVRWLLFFSCVALYVLSIASIVYGLYIFNYTENGSDKPVAISDYLQLLIPFTPGIVTILIFVLIVRRSLKNA